jgi:UDP-N-acetylglucosamine 3-dehydrogenase
MPINTKIRIGILSQAHPHAHSYSHSLAQDPAVDLVGIWDEDPVAGAGLAAARGTRYFADLSELLSQGLDGAMIASENSYHRRLTEAAAKAGVRAILCEKPIATTVADAQEMIDACAASGSKLAIAFPCRFSPVFQRLNDAVHAGKLGTIVAIRATNHGKCPFGWFVEPEKSGGGAIIDHTVHVADANRVLLGAEAVEVYAESGNNMYHQSWEDCGFLTITYNNSVFTTLDSSWSRPNKSFPTWGDVTLEVIGTDGIASMDMFRQSAILHTESDGHTTELGWGSNIDAAMVADFLTLAGGGESPTIATGHDGLKALEVALAAYESVRMRQVVKV